MLSFLCPDREIGYVEDQKPSRKAVKKVSTNSSQFLESLCERIFRHYHGATDFLLAFNLGEIISITLPTSLFNLAIEFLDTRSF